MDSVKLYRADWRHVVQTVEDDAQYVGINDYKNKCHSSDTYYRAWKHSKKEFDAAQAELAALREELDVQRESKEQWEKVAADWVNKAQVFSTLMQEFCDRVDRGEIRSKATYAKFKAALKPTESGASE